MGRRPITKSVEFSSVTRVGVKIWGFKISTQKILNSVKLYRILDLPGAATTAPAQHISSVAAVERSISEIGDALERRGAEPSALQMVRERIRAREVNATQGVLTPLEAGPS